MFNFFKRKKQDEAITYSEDFALMKQGIYRDSSLGELKEGENKNNVVVNIVSRREIKKEYTIGGVLDQEQRNNWKAWFYLAPILILMAVFLIYPLINTIFISFTENYQYATGTFDGLTFDNFLIILGLKPYTDALIYETNLVNYALPNTFLIVFITVPVSIVLALLISVLLNNLRWFQKIYQTIFFLPYVTNTIAVGMVFSVLFDDTGLINYLFTRKDIKAMAAEYVHHILLNPAAKIGEAKEIIAEGVKTARDDD